MPSTNRTQSSGNDGGDISMKAIVQPRLLIGCGESGWAIVKLCKEEYLLQYPELGEKDHDTAICLRLLPEDHSTRRIQVQDLCGETFPLESGIRDSLHKLFQKFLLSKNAKKRFETEDVGGGLRRIHVHVVADIASAYGKSFCENDWPALVEAIANFKAVAPALGIYVSLFLMVGNYDDNENEKRDVFTVRLSQVKYTTAQNWPFPRPKIYFVDKWATDMTELAESDLKDIVTVFLESLLVPTLLPVEAGAKDVNFLWIVGNEQPYSSFGVKMVGLPTVDISNYACDQGISKVIDYFLSAPKERVFNSFHEHFKTDSSDQEEFSIPSLRSPPKISKRLTKRGIGALDTAVSGWKIVMSDWASKTAAAVKAPNYDCGKIYEAKRDELINELKGAFDTIPGCLERASSTINHWKKICKSASEAIKRDVSTEMRFDPAVLCSKEFKAFEVSQQKLRKALQEYPDSRPVFLFFALCTMLMAFFLTLMIWPLTTSVLALIIGLGGPVALNLVLVAFTLRAPTKHVTKCQNDFQEDMDHYANKLERCWGKKLQQFHNQHQESVQNLAYHLLERKVKHYAGRLEFFEKLLRDRRDNCRQRCTQIDKVGSRLANGEEVEPDAHRLRISKARTYILDERDFNQFYLNFLDTIHWPDRLRVLEYSASKTNQSNVFDLFFKDIFDIFPFDAYLKIEQVVRDVYAGIFSENDFADSDTTFGIKDRLKAALQDIEDKVLVQVNKNLDGKGWDTLLVSVKDKDHIPSKRVEDLAGCRDIVVRRSVDPHKVYLYRVKRDFSDNDFVNLTS